MDTGEFARAELTVTPAANGSYLVRRNWYGDRDQYRMNAISEMACFTDYGDLLAFLNEEYRAANISPASNPDDPTTHHHANHRSGENG